MVKILLVEDNPADVDLVQLALNQANLPHDLHVITDGGEALSVVRQLGKPGQLPCPDVVIFDVNLPKIEGPELLREFRKQEGCAETPAIIISSESSAESARIAGLKVSAY